MARKSTGLCVLWSHLHYACVLTVVLTEVGLSQGGKHCKQVNKCLTREYNQAVMNNDKDTLCREIPGILKCIHAAEEVCGDLGDKFNSARDKMEESYDMSCKDKRQEEPSVRPDPDSHGDSMPGYECVEMMKKCITSDLQRAQMEDDAELICVAGPKAIQCMEHSQRKCANGDPSEEQIIKTIKQSVDSRCDNASAALHFSPILVIMCLLVLLDNLKRAAF